jgi:hypothetical protein
MASLWTMLGHFTRDTKMKNVKIFVALTTENKSQSAIPGLIIVCP